MKLKIIKNLSGQSLIVVGRPSVGTVFFTLVLFVTFICSIIFGSDSFGTVALFLLFLLFVFLIFQSFIRLEISVGQEVVYRNGLKIERLAWQKIKSFLTYFNTRTAKGTTIHAADITAVCDEGEINIFHVASGEWGKNNQAVWQEMKDFISSIKF